MEERLSASILQPATAPVGQDPVVQDDKDYPSSGTCHLSSAADSGSVAFICRTENAVRITLDLMSSF